MSPKSMHEETWIDVDRYITDLLMPDPVLEAALEAGAAAGLPSISVSPPLGKLLYLLARARGARRILEVGTLAGYSAILLGRALPPDGRLVTLEMESKHAAVARSNFERAGLDRVIEIRVGPARETLQRMKADGEEPFDLIFIDADKVGYPEYFALALDLSHRGTWIVADNVVRDGAVANPASEDANVQAVRRYNELMAAEPRVTATVIQTVGSKGYDGFALALVVADR